MTTTTPVYPDWQDQGWYCRECAVTAWNASPGLRSLTTTTEGTER